MAERTTIREVLPILIGAAVMLSLSMGFRQSLGLFMQPAVQDLGIAVADFTLAIAVQNLVWGALQAIAGAWAVRIGFRPMMLAGAVCYLAGLVVLGTAQGAAAVTIGAGVLIGIALSCTASAFGLAVAARAAPTALRSTVLGIVSGAGSFGSLISAPLGQYLSEGFGWRAGVLGFAVLAVAMIPAALFAGRVDRIPLPPPRSGGEAATAGAALKLAMGHAPFMIMAAAFFVCGLQLVFLTTHLPSYLALCGMDPMLSAQALMVVGGFNILGSVFFGWAGGRFSKPLLLGGIYFCRSLALGFYFMDLPTPAGTLVFAGVLGFLWLGVGPLVAGMITEMFGLRWQAMLQGVAFTSHQLGSFAGAYGGGLLFDAMGSYDLAWKLGVAMGLTAGVVQMLMAVPRGSGGRLARAAPG